MRRILLLGLILSFVSCKYETRQELNSENEIIRLSTGHTATKAGNRDDQTGFATDDKIGVISYYSKKVTSDASDADEPNFDVAPHFINRPATAQAPVGESVKTNLFDWVTPQYFPQGKNIFLFAYYPYNDGGATPNEGVTFKPLAASASPYGPDALEVDLLDETITDLDKNITQPDVLVARHGKSINRATTTENDLKLTFKHILAQVQFKIIKAASVNATVEFKTITFKVPGKANFAIGDVATYSALSSDEDDVTTYSITSAGTEINSASSTPVLDNPIMVLPYTADDLKKATLTVGVDYGGATMSFDVPFTDVTNGLAQGTLNVLNLTVNKTEISLKATIEAWGTGNTIELPLE